MTAEPRRRSSWAVWIAGAVMLLPVLYVGAYGPTGAYIHTDSVARVNDGSLHVWYAAYAPLDWLAEQFPPMQEWLDRYVSLWP